MRKLLREFWFDLDPGIQLVFIATPVLVLLWLCAGCPRV